MDCSRIGASTFSNSSGGGLAAHAISARASRFSTQSGTAASIRPSQDLCPSRERATGMPSQTAGATLCAVAEGTCSPRCSGREGSCVEIGAPFFYFNCLTKPGHRGLLYRSRVCPGSPRCLFTGTKSQTTGFARVCVAHRTRRGPAIPPLHDAPPPPRAPHTSL